MADPLDANALLAARRSRHRPLRLGRRHLSRPLRQGRGADTQREHGPCGPAHRRGQYPLAADRPAALLRRPREVSASTAEVIERPTVRHRRAALGHHAAACADVGRPRCACAALLGGDAPLPAAGTGRAGRSTPRAGRRGMARDQRTPAELAAQPPLQRHAGRRAARGRADLGLRFSRADADRVVARADGHGRRRPALGPARAIPHPPDDAAGVPVRPAEEILGAEGFPRDALPRLLRLLSRCPRALHPPRSGAVHRLAHQDGGGPHRGARRAPSTWQRSRKCTPRLAAPASTPSSTTR